MRRITLHSCLLSLGLSLAFLSPLDAQRVDRKTQYDRAKKGLTPQKFLEREQLIMQLAQNAPRPSGTTGRTPGSNPPNNNGGGANTETNANGENNTGGANTNGANTNGASNNGEGAGTQGANQGNNAGQNNGNNGNVPISNIETDDQGQPILGDNQEAINPEPGKELPKVSIYDGQILVRDFLKFLSDFTGLTVIADTTNQTFLDQPVTIIAPIHDADEELVKALLKANNINLFRERLKNGREIFRVESAQPASTRPSEPKPIVILKPDQLDTAILKPDEFATMVFTLRHIAPRDAIQGLQSLISGSSGSRVGSSRGGAAGGVSISKSFSMVEIENSQMLIITAKYGLLSYLRNLLDLIDVPIDEPERIIEIKQIEWADAGEIESIVSQFIQGRGGAGSRFGRLGQRQVSSTSRSSSSSGSPTLANQRTTDFSTKIISDLRTNQLIIETYNEQDLEDIEMLISELDVRFDLRRVRTNIYQVRYLKAVEVAQDLQLLIQGQSSGTLGGAGRSSRAGLNRRTSSIPRVSSGSRSSSGQTQGNPQNAEVASLIVPHEPTNSLLIQSEPEDYEEILHILKQIDTKRRQVFLEAALVQVQASSDLNYAIELIAGNPDDRATRGLFAQNFGLTGIDSNFNRVLPFPADPGTLPAGGLAAIMSRGDLPFIIRFFKSHSDSQILATPFIVADDNEENRIDILETRFVQNTTTQNNQTTLSSQQGEPAGITLSIVPTISGSNRAVFLEMDLSVSEFAEATAPGTLPPKSENTVTSAVTIPDGRMFVVGGLTRENKSKVVSKVPLLGDVPLLGKLFRSEQTVNSHNNLYVFLQAHILTHEDFDDSSELTEQARLQMEKLGEGLDPLKFRKPKVQRTRRGPSLEDLDRERYLQLNNNVDNTNSRINPYTNPNTNTGTSPNVPSSTGNNETGTTGWLDDGKDEENKGFKPVEKDPAQPPPRKKKSTGWLDG